MTVKDAWDIVQSNVGESGTYIGDECRDALNQIDDVVNSHAQLVKALPPPEKLRLLADWFDVDDANKGGQRGDIVQKDLRQWANAIEAALAAAKGE